MSLGRCLLKKGAIMRFTCIAFGTRGDAQPAIALGRALQAGGHAVRLVASAHFKDWIEGYGLEAAPSQVDIQALMASEGGQDWAERGTNQLEQSRLMRRLMGQVGLTMMQDAWGACQDADVVVSSFTSDVYAVSIAEKLGARHISMLLQPSLVATRRGAATLLAPLPRRDSWVNYWFGKLILEPAPWTLLGDVATRFRRDILRLPPQTARQNRAARRRMLVLHAYSRHVTPQPPEWPPNFHTTGYWFLDEGQSWQPPDELRRFLDAGEPPVAIGFGSMTGRDPARLTRLVVEAVERAGCRAVVLAGWAGMGAVATPERVLRLEAAPHDWLFPRVRAVVHHGGAGTTAAGLRAGQPTVIVPHLGDQPYWGQRVVALGVGPRAIPRPKLTVAALADALRLVTMDRGMQARAADLGAKIRAEDGVAVAVEVIERYVQS